MRILERGTLFRLNKKVYRVVADKGCCDGCSFKTEVPCIHIKNLPDCTRTRSIFVEVPLYEILFLEKDVIKECQQED